MSLVSPKRLFHVPFMTTFMYEDIAEDVEEKGYAAVSHVWGEQQMHSADQLGINGGVDWKVPLSNPNKIRRLVDAMNRYGMEYCWFDVLCMPQDKQDEINKEIPFMGDYYNAADITFVLSDNKYNISENYPKWHSMVSDIVEKKRSPTSEEHTWLAGQRHLMNFSTDVWFDRVWTLQEAVLSKKIVIADPNGLYVDLSGIINMLSYMSSKSAVYVSPFLDRVQNLLGIVNATTERKEGVLDLAKALSISNARDCYKIHDKFYGAFGMLDYKDFTVNYDMSIDELNIAIIRYAYSKGDVSWMAVGDDQKRGLVQPMYMPFPYAGVYWKECVPDTCLIMDDSLYMRAMDFGVVTKSKKYQLDTDMYGDVAWTANVASEWGFESLEIFAAMLGYVSVPDEIRPAGVTFVDHILGGKSLEDALLGAVLHIRDKEYYVLMGDILGKISINLRPYKSSARVVEVDVHGVNQRCFLIISGCAEVGDEIMVPRLRDPAGRNLGIVVDKSLKRKGVCLVPQIRIGTELENTFFIDREFPL